MRIKISILCLFLLGFSINIQAQRAIPEKKVQLNTTTKTEKVAIATSSKSSSQQTKDNIRRRNMAKYKAMSRKPRSAATKTRRKKSSSRRGK